MAVLGRLLLGSAERLDLPDLLSIDSYTSADFKYLIQSFIGSDTPYILRGFDVIQPQDSIGTESISIRIADSVTYYPSSTAGSFFYGLEEGNVNAQPLIPELRKNATNFVYLTFTTFDTARDSRAFWDPDQNGGDGGEFSQDINTESALTVDVGVSVSTFPEGTIPVCKVVVGPSVIESIEDARDMMFRLGTGGVTPNPFSNYDFRDEPSSAYSRTEPPTIMTSALDPNPFQGGDKNIFTLKEWMDTVMTILKEITGATFWYSPAAGGGGSGGANIFNTWEDALGSTLKSKGEWIHDESVAGRVTWTEDVVYHSLTDPREIIVRANTIDISNNDDVVFIELERNEEINTSSTTVTWQNGVNTVNGVVGAFESLSKGDWVKKAADPDYYYLRVEEFYALPGQAGGATTPALAQSIRLSGNYAGASGNAIGEYTKGEFLLTDIQVEPRSTSTIDTVGGNFFWLAYRSDTSLGLEGITPTQLSVDITDADGVVATCTAVGHGLEDGDRLTITTGSYAGTHTVSVEDANTFYINTAVTGDEAGQDAFYAIVETRARNTGFSYQLESANHGFESGQRISISGTASSYDDSYIINRRSDTTFQIPIGSLIPDPGTIDGEIVTLTRVNVRTEFGTVKVVQGESIDIGDPDTSNILSYLGMPSLAVTSPIYDLPLSYNALNGAQNYNCSTDDDITLRVSKLTAMMADRVQERGFNLRGRVNITSTTNGLNQDITASGLMTLHKPGSPEQTIDLTVSLPANSAAVTTIDRDGGSALTLSVESLGNPFLLEENKLILFYRFSDDIVHTWDRQQIEPYGHYNFGNLEDAQNKNITLVNIGNLTLDDGSDELLLNVPTAAQVTDITMIPAASVPQSSYFELYSANDVTEYYVWYNLDAGGVDPAIGGKTGIEVAITTGQSAADVANATDTEITSAAAADFNTSVGGGTLTIENTTSGPTTDTVDGATATTFGFNTVADGADSQIEILIPGSASNIIDSQTIDGLASLLLPENSSIWVRIDRFAQKTFNTVAFADGADTVGAGKLYSTLTADVPVDQDVVVLWSRLESTNIIEHHKAQTTNGNIYEEYIDYVAAAPGAGESLPITSGTTIILPDDSRDPAAGAQTYVVGSGQIKVFLNGQALRRGVDYNEIGTADTLSNKIEILQDLVAGDALCFRLDSEGSVWLVGSSGGGGGGGSLQDAYDTGRFISVTAGQPVVISGTGTIASFIGDVDVDGSLTGQFIHDIRTESSDYTVTLDDDVILVDASGGVIEIDLPAAATATGKRYEIKKIDGTANAVNINGDGAELIDSSNTLSTTIQYESFSVVSNGTQWWIV